MQRLEVGVSPANLDKTELLAHFRLYRGSLLARRPHNAPSGEIYAGMPIDACRTTRMAGSRQKLGRVTPTGRPFIGSVRPQNARRDGGSVPCGAMRASMASKGLALPSHRHVRRPAIASHESEEPADVDRGATSVAAAAFAGLFRDHAGDRLIAPTICGEILKRPGSFVSSSVSRVEDHPQRQVGASLILRNPSPAAASRLASCPWLYRVRSGVLP
jgi:hypothetical protein